MDFVAIRAALATWFSSVTGLRAQDKEGVQDWGGTWAGAYSGSPASANGLLHLVVVGTLGTDRRKYITNLGAPQGSEIEPHIQGQRSLRWEIQVQSLSQKAGEDAAFYLDKIRNLIHADSAIAAFGAVDLGVRNISDSVDLTLLKNNRRISLAQLDIMFNAAVDIQDAAFGYVNRFEVDTEWRDSEGNLLPNELQFSGEIIV